MKVFRRLSAIALVAISGVGVAQVSTGTPPFASLGGGPFDILNLGNLNMHFAIPVRHKAGRGAVFTYDLSYDSSIWTPVTSGGTTQWQPATNFGWRGITEAKTGYLSYSTTSVNIGNNCTQLEFAWTYHDSFGAQHPFPGYSSVLISGFHTCSGSTIIATTASDGSGYSINGRGAAASVTNRAGKVIAAPLNSTSGAGTMTDANGNQLTANSSGQFFDTLSSSTPVLTVAGSGTPSSPLTFTYTAPTGGAAIYKMNYKQYTVATNFGATTNSGATIAEFGATSVSLVDNVALPDGSSYSFTYEQTPSVPSTGKCTPLSGTFSQYCVTARMASITLPTGGTITYTYTGGTNGIENDGGASGLTRGLTATTTAPAQSWSYTRALVGGTPPGPGSTWTTTVIDSSGNNTVINFAEDSTVTNSGSNPPTIATYNVYETKGESIKAVSHQVTC